RRALVVRSFAEYFGYLDHGARKPTLQSCGAGSDAACTELLRSLPPGVLPRPLTYDARAALVHIALRLGGREAYHRLIATAARRGRPGCATSRSDRLRRGYVRKRSPLSGVRRTWRCGSRSIAGGCSRNCCDGASETRRGRRCSSRHPTRSQRSPTKC